MLKSRSLENDRWGEGKNPVPYLLNDVFPFPLKVNELHVRMIFLSYNGAAAKVRMAKRQVICLSPPCLNLKFRVFLVLYMYQAMKLCPIPAS